MEQGYVYHNGKKLRKGYTTGSCATAAATAAALLLFHDEEHESVNITTPNDVTLHIPIETLERDEESATASVRKDGGDDADATHGMLIYVTVKKLSTPDILIDGGVGIGRVTQEGLLEPVGFAAINPTPRQMIETSVRQIIGPNNGAEVIVFAPEGEQIAKQTMNGHLGIVGGISILGTTGIVTPMSEESWKSAITIELEMKHKQGLTSVVLSPGNYGEDFAVNELHIPSDKIVSMSNFVGYVLKEVQRIGFTKILMVGHLGKFIKIAAGIFSTHSKDADARTETLIANLALLGMPVPDLKRIEECKTTESAGDIIEELGYEQVYQIIADKIQQRSSRLLKYGEPEVAIDVVLFSSKRGYLASTRPVAELMEEWQ